MSGYSRFMCVFLWIVTMLTAAVLIVHFTRGFGPETIQGRLIAEHATTIFASLVIFGFVLIALDLLWVWLGLKGRSSRPVAFKSKRGDIFVTAGALEEALAKTAKGHADVADVRVRVRVPARKRAQIKVATTVVLWDRPQVINAQWSIQELLEERFREIISSEQPVRFDVTLRRLKTRGKGAEPVVEDAPAFTGPEYPVRDAEQNEET